MVDTTDRPTDLRTSDGMMTHAAAAVALNNILYV